MTYPIVQHNMRVIEQFDNLEEVGRAPKLAIWSKSGKLVIYDQKPNSLFERIIHIFNIAINAVLFTFGFLSTDESKIGKAKLDALGGIVGEAANDVKEFAGKLIGNLAGAF